MNEIVQLFYQSKVDYGSFSVGTPWQYEDGNKGKYAKSEYRVYKYYNDFKEEMLNYEYLDTHKIKQIIIKAQQYVNAAIAKSLTKENKSSESGLSIDHLICIIMYCDYTHLSNDFTLSFRKSHQCETLQQIKRRNSKYFHWSKTLKNLIKDYG